ncbi:hypothetical protein BVY04_04130 [bacterium M21]|nr:hypothetical protein BVY04_04130 [bacterium M21]
MLGLISVMALTSMAITVRRREQKDLEQFVKLNNIPSNLVPLHIRCSKSAIHWQNDQGKWQVFSLNTQAGQAPSGKFRADMEAFLAFLETKAAANHALSYANKQHTLILWIEPDGILLALELQRMISEFGLPLRVGQLPLLDNESIQKSSVEK